MKIELWVLNSRVKYLMTELDDNFNIIETDDDNANSNQFTRVEITINNSCDLLKVFHAGMAAGEANE